MDMLRSIFLVEVDSKELNKLKSKSKYGQSLIKQKLTKKKNRFSLGYFDSILEAQIVIDDLSKNGVENCFIKEVYIDRITPLQIIGTTEVNYEILPEKDLTKNNDGDSLSVNLFITGKSFGVLGNTRFQNEHEMITDWANEKELEFKLVSHACWSSKGITVFFPSDEPVGDELDHVLNTKNHWEYIRDISALRTNDVLLFQDLERNDINLLEVIRSNPLIASQYPEVREVSLQVYRTILEGGIECLIVLEEEFYLPQGHHHWTIGEFNRVDVDKQSRIYEIPLIKGGFGERATILRSLEENYNQSIKIDLGHRYADQDLSDDELFNIDIAGLGALGYDILVPYINELLLGNQKLDSVISKTDLELLASNLTAKKNKKLFKSFLVKEFDQLKIGFLGLVDPEITLDLSEKLLQELSVHDPIDEAKKMVDSLHNLNVDLIVALSNMSKANNARLSAEVLGIDIITSDFSNQGELKGYTSHIAIDTAINRGFSHPYIISNIPDFGVGVGHIKVDFHINHDQYRLSSIEEDNHIVDLSIISDFRLMDSLLHKVELGYNEKGPLLMPAFIDIVEQRPALKYYDETTRNGRISKELWESFVARILATKAPAEIAIIRPLGSFLPLVGKLHEREVKSWLWFEDEVVLIDMKGRDLKRLLDSHIGRRLATSGLEAVRWEGGGFYKVMGRPIIDDVYYKVATTNIICNGALKEYFHLGLRKVDRFDYLESGELRSSRSGEKIVLKEYILEELRKIRALGKGKIHHKNVANLLLPETPYEKLFSFNFIKPTLWTTLNRSYKGSGYDAIPESRIISNNSFVIGVAGGLNTTIDTEKNQWNLGFYFAFAEQSAELENGLTQVTENADDVNINLSYQFKGNNPRKLHPYIRMEYDSEFTPTLNTSQNLINPRQKVLRNIFGFSKSPSPKWPVLELGANAENDLSNGNYQYGIQARSLGRFPLDPAWNIVYSLTNNFNYYLPNKDDSERDLAFKYNMIHEVQIPLFGDISLSVAADLFFFQGKTEINDKPGMSMLMKLGLTYNRLWKPRFQSLF